MAKIPYFHPSYVEVDLRKLKKNISLVRSYIGDKTLYCLPVKANAYGHGLTMIGEVAQQEGIDYLAVAHLQEGILLRQEGVTIPILVVGAIHEDQIVDLIRSNLEISISSVYKAKRVAEICHKQSIRCRVHIEVDTGMQRTGVRPSTALLLFEYMKEHPCFDIVGIYSHFAKADIPDDPFTNMQIEAFRTLLQDPVFKGVSLIRHLANSSGTIFFKESHLDMVRPGILSFGYFSSNCPESLHGIEPCYSVKSRVSYFKVVEKGQGISYNHTYYTPEKTHIITVPIGYGDGVPRSLSNRGSVLIRGKRFPMVGNICMDQFMVDVGQHHIEVGDEVVIIGKQGNEEISVEEFAKLCQTIPYEVLCFFNNRLPRAYLS